LVPGFKDSRGHVIREKLFLAALESWNPRPLAPLRRIRLN
jgi:hypothetical protein